MHPVSCVKRNEMYLDDNNDNNDDNIFADECI
jgi:hypothetical protein